jgi:hypothetical protein
MTTTIRRFARWARYVVTPLPHRSRWQDRLFTGHVSWGPVTIYGANAMHWAINVWAFGHYWCFHPTTRTFGGYWPWYFYISKNATPWAACYIREGGYIE